MSISKTAFESIVGRIKYYFKTHGYTKTINIYDNIGAAVNDYKKENSDTIQTALYGICRRQTSQVSALTDTLHIVTGAAVLDLLIDAVADENGNYTEADTIVELLNECSNYITGDWYETATNNTTGDSGAVTCAVFPVVSLPTVGICQEESSNFGAYIPVSVQLNFTAVQGAMPPAGIRLAIDGTVIPTIELVVSRSKAATTDVTAQSANGSTANSEESSTLEIQFSCPAYFDTTGGILDEIFDGGTNIPHCVVLNAGHTNITGAPTWSGCYMMTIAKAQMTKNAGATIGLNCNLLEISPQSADFTVGGWSHNTVTASSGNMTGRTYIPAGSWCIFWGDGTASGVVESSGAYFTHTYKRAGTYDVYWKLWG